MKSYFPVTCTCARSSKLSGQTHLALRICAFLKIDRFVLSHIIAKRWRLSQCAVSNRTNDNLFILWTCY